MFVTLYYRGGTAKGIWHAALPLGSAAEAEAQSASTENAGFPCVVVSESKVDIALAQLAADFTPPTAWWDFANQKRTLGRPGTVPTEALPPGHRAGG